jgi:hypothetical protein
MRNRLFALLISFILVGQSLYAQFFPVDTAVLNNTYKELMKDPQSMIKQRKFFDAFPSTWKDFIMTYQFSPNKDYDLSMYNVAEKHINIFGSILMNIPDSIVALKIIDLSIGGVWEADAPLFLQDVIREYIMQSPMPVFDALGFYSDGKQLRFWQFVFTNPVRYDKSREMVLHLADKIDEKKHRKKITIMTTAYDFADGEEAYDSR